MTSATKTPSSHRIRRRLTGLLRAVDSCHGLLESLVAASARHRRHLLTPEGQRKLQPRRSSDVSNRIRRLRSDLLAASRRFAAVSAAVAAAATAEANTAAAAAVAVASCPDHGVEPSTRTDGPSTSSMGVLTSEEANAEATPTPSPPPRTAAAAPVDSTAASVDSFACLRRAIARRLAQCRRLLDSLAADLLPPGDAAAVVRVSLQIWRPALATDAAAPPGGGTATTSITRSLNNCRRRRRWRREATSDVAAMDGHGDSGGDFGGIAFRRVLGAAEDASGRHLWRQWWN